MFSSSSTSANFKGLRRKATNDVNPSTLHVARPFTATSTDYYHSPGMVDILEPALNGPPSPEGIRAFSRRMKRGSITEQPLNELAPSSGSSSLRSEALETSWEPSLESPSLSRNPSQRSSVMPLKERPDSMQLFGKAVFSRKSKLRRGHSDHGNSLLSLTELPPDSVPDLPKEQRFIQSMFTRRRARGDSEASTKKIQISGPYDFQHVSHSSKETLSGSDLEEVSRYEALPGLQGARPRTKTGPSNTPGGLNLQALDKPLPTPPSPEYEFERALSRDSIQFSPPRLPRSVSDNAQTSPIPPPPRTSSRISLRHDRNDSFTTIPVERLRTNSSSLAELPILPHTDELWPASVSHVSSYSEPHTVGDDEKSLYSVSTTTDDTAWPLTGSMSSLPEVPEEEEYHLTTIRSRTSVISNTTSLRGSVSVPHLRRISLNQAAQRPPSNASDTLGRFDLFAAQRALREYDEEDMNEDNLVHDSWEDDIDYCYDHEAEADCDFAWERPSCDLEREHYFPDSPVLRHQVETSFASFEPVPVSHLSADVPALSPTSYGSGMTQHGATTPTTSTTPITSNFSLPRIDSSTQLKHEHERSLSSVSSLQEEQGFCLSPSLLIPNDYHEKMLQYGRGELSSHASSDELKIWQHDDISLKFERSGTYLHPRSSASTTMSTLSERSVTSSRYPSSTFTRWTGSSSSSWQVPIDSQQPVTITLNDKEPIITPTSDIDVVSPSEPPATLAKQDAGREGHSRAQSEATLLTKVSHDTVAPLESKVANESSKTHRRARTASRSHANASPQFALFPQVPQRP
ncbi:hypothetical protein FHL15_008690 [Xylaria flabelliformis]|uniref:CRIB domain-containing protein n=1 Tax=Xylaria flabelliformis TaxID=2512241 RepID=A0A553HQU6_9PEZI|nr:hypothetical protein FHL15_008690 [Xylaria flabelliformis]